jgi:hypothetical protein
MSRDCVSFVFCSLHTCCQDEGICTQMVFFQPLPLSAVQTPPGPHTAVHAPQDIPCKRYLSTTPQGNADMFPINTLLFPLCCVAHKTETTWLDLTRADEEQLDLEQRAAVSLLSANQQGTFWFRPLCSDQYIHDVLECLEPAAKEIAVNALMPYISGLALT